MEIVVDVNVIISSLLSKGDAFKVFAKNYALRKFDFVVPEFLLTELNNHKAELINKTKLIDYEFDEVLNLVIEQISFFSYSQVKDFVSGARKSLSEHLKDVPYLALALKLKCDIFSGDKKLKRLSPVNVISPKEMIDKMHSNL